MDRYYRILGISPGATEAQIKKAYRKMAMRYHPDKAEGSKEKFLEILTAYEVLTGVRKAKNERPQASTNMEDLARFYEILKKAAEEKARARYRERAAKLRQERAEAQGRAYQQGIVSLVIIVILAAASFWAYPRVIERVIAQDPREAFAEVTGLANRRVLYQFPVEGGYFKDEAFVSKVGIRMVGEAGLPLTVGDRIRVRFKAGDPSYNQLIYHRISEATLQRYLILCQDKLMVLGVVQSDRPRAQAACMTLLIYQKFGLDGLATVLFAEEHPLESWQHNRWTWQSLQEEESFGKIIDICASRFEGPSK